MERKMKAFILSCMMIVTACGVSLGYGAELFETTSHNFGTVLKGAKTEFDFVFTNPYNQALVVESVSTSCQCTSPSVSPGVLQPGQKGRVHISVNTKSFQGNKNATITVRFSRPYRMEVQLHSYVYIRNDISINPGLVYFGTVTAGTKPSVQVRVNSVNSNWAIRDVRSGCKFLSVTLPNPTQNYNGTSYLMTITLEENAAPGPFSEVLELITNDSSPSYQRIPIRVEGRVKDTLNINPSSLSFGLVNVGEKSTKTIVVQGGTPFQIKDITSECPYISAALENEKSNIRTVRLTYNAKEEGEFNGTITVLTDLEGKTEASIPFYGKAIAKKEVKPEVKPEVVETPEVPEIPEVPETPDVPETLPETLPEALPEVETPAATELPKATEVPEELELPVETELPEETELPAEPEEDALELPLEEEAPAKPELELPAPEETPVATPEELPNALPLPDDTEDENASEIMEILPSEEDNGILELDTDSETPVEELPAEDEAPVENEVPVEENLEIEENLEMEETPETEETPASLDPEEDILDEVEIPEAAEEIEEAPATEAPKSEAKGRNLLKAKAIQ